MTPCMTQQPACASLTVMAKFPGMPLFARQAWLKHGNGIQGQGSHLSGSNVSVLAARIGERASPHVSPPTLCWIPDILISQPGILVRRSRTNCSVEVALLRVNTTRLRNTGTSTLCLQSCVDFFFFSLCKRYCLHLSCVCNGCYGYQGTGKH